MRFPVEVQSVAVRRVEYVVAAVGTIEPFEVVQITARVAGALDSVKFREGDLVSEGALLAQIDSERYHLAVDSARAAVSKAEAAKLDAEEGLTRRDELNKTSEGLVRGEELATFRTKVKTAEADLAAAEANLQIAQLNDRGANVRALFSGVIAQTRAVVTGQQVQPGTVLATLVRRDPLMLKFAVPEQEAARLRPGIKATLKVRSTELQHTATLTHVSEVAENVGRTVAISAKIDPGASGLRAGGFAEVTIPVQAKENAVVIPATAIRPSERGFLAFVIEKNAEQNIARERILLLGHAYRRRCSSR